MNSFFSKILILSVLLSVVVPVAVLAETQQERAQKNRATEAKCEGGDCLVICGRDLNGDGMVKGPNEECGFNDIVHTIRVIIKYLLLVAGSLAAISFAYAGYLYLTSGGAEDKIHHAHEIFWKVAVGFVIILAAWLIVKTIESSLVATDSGIKSFLVQ